MNGGALFFNLMYFFPNFLSTLRDRICLMSAILSGSRRIGGKQPGGGRDKLVVLKLDL